MPSLKLTCVVQVLVTGASGRTGKLVFQKLLDHPVFFGRGLVSSKKVLHIHPPFLAGSHQNSISQ